MREPFVVDAASLPARLPKRYRMLPADVR